MSFAFVSARCSSGVEITQAGVRKTVNLVEPGKHALDQQLRLTIRVGRLQQIVLFDRSTFWIAKEGGGGRKNQPLDLRGNHGFEQVKRIRGIVAEKISWSFHRLTRFDQSSEMHDCIKGTGAKQLV